MEFCQQESALTTLFTFKLLRKYQTNRRPHSAVTNTKNQLEHTIRIFYDASLFFTIYFVKNVNKINNRKTHN